MICVECGFDCPEGVYKEFSKGSVRLTRCEHCHATADKYVEFELMLICIDLMLHKPAVYRHLLYNRFPQRERGFEASLLRLVPFFLFFDGYLKWFVLSNALSEQLTFGIVSAGVASPLLDWLEQVAFAASASPFASWLAVVFRLLAGALKSMTDLSAATSTLIFRSIGSGGRGGGGFVSGDGFWFHATVSALWGTLTRIAGVGEFIDGAAVASILHVAVIVILENVAYVLGVLVCLQLVCRIFRIPLLRSNYVVMALILSCFAKFGVIPLFIWPDFSRHHSFATVITLFVLTSQVTALKVAFGSRMWLAILCILCGLVCRSVCSALVVYFCTV